MEPDKNTDVFFNSWSCSTKYKYDRKLVSWNHERIFNFSQCWLNYHHFSRPAPPEHHSSSPKQSQPSNCFRFHYILPQIIIMSKEVIDYCLQSQQFPLHPPVPTVWHRVRPVGHEEGVGDVLGEDGGGESVVVLVRPRNHLVVVVVVVKVVVIVVVNSGCE